MVYSTPVLQPQKLPLQPQPQSARPRHERRNSPCGLKGLESASEIHLEEMGWKWDMRYELGHVCSESSPTILEILFGFRGDETW